VATGELRSSTKRAAGATSPGEVKKKKKGSLPGMWSGWWRRGKNKEKKSFSMTTKREESRLYQSAFSCGGGKRKGSVPFFLAGCRIKKVSRLSLLAAKGKKGESTLGSSRRGERKDRTFSSLFWPRTMGEEEKKGGRGRTAMLASTSSRPRRGSLSSIARLPGKKRGKGARGTDCRGKGCEKKSPRSALAILRGLVVRGGKRRKCYGPGPRLEEGKPPSQKKGGMRPGRA